MLKLVLIKKLILRVSLAKFLEEQENNFVVVYNFPFTNITQTVLTDGLFS